jgi:hypothetical protein
MSKLLIQRSGRASSKLTGNGTGGLVLAPDAKIQSMKYDFKYGYALGSAVVDGGGDGTGDADEDVNVLHFPATNNILYQTGNDTQSAARSNKAMLAAGLTLAAAGESYEFAPYFSKEDESISSPAVGGHNVFSVGLSDFYMRAVLQCADVSAATEIFAGFKKVEGFEDDPDDFDEAYGVSIHGGGNPADVKEFKILNAAATVRTDTGINKADATDIEIEVRVSKAGVCTLFVDGVQLNATDHSIVGMTFDAGEQVYPALYVVLTVAATLTISELEFGAQAARK